MCAVQPPSKQIMEEQKEAPSNTLEGYSGKFAGYGSILKATKNFSLKVQKIRPPKQLSLTLSVFKRPILSSLIPITRFCSVLSKG